MQPSAFAIEVWTKGGLLLADLSGRADGRKIHIGRNQADGVQWKLNLDELDELAATMRTTADQLLNVGANEIRVRYGKKYLAGGRLMWSQRQHDGKTRWISLKTIGFLDLFKRRFTDELLEFVGTDVSALAWGLIDHTQSTDAYHDFGVTLGSLTTIRDIDREYLEDEIKDSLLKLTDSENFDLEITPTKVFNTYAPIGSYRRSVVFEFPGNIKPGYTVTRDANGMANHIRAMGSGSGTYGAIRATSDDIDSQLTYDTFEAKLLSSSTKDPDQLQDEADAEKAAIGRPSQLITFAVDGNKQPFLTDYGIGDYVAVKIKKEGINGFYRIEAIDIEPDKDDVIDVKVTVSQ